jgi:hypothetical protein
MKVVTGGADPADPSSSLVSYQDFLDVVQYTLLQLLLSPLSPTATLEIEFQMRHQPGRRAAQTKFQQLLFLTYFFCKIIDRERERNVPSIPSI